MKACEASVLAVVLSLHACVQKPEPPASGETSPLVQGEKWWKALPRPGYASLEKVGVFDDWFEVYHLGEGTYAIYEPYQFQEALSYLVLGTERAALVDSGNGIGRIERAVEALTELPVIVLLTHEHSTTTAEATPSRRSRSSTIPGRSRAFPGAFPTSAPGRSSRATRSGTSSPRESMRKRSPSTE